MFYYRPNLINNASDVHLTAIYKRSISGDERGRIRRINKDKMGKLESVENIRKERD